MENTAGRMDTTTTPKVENSKGERKSQASKETLSSAKNRLFATLNRVASSVSSGQSASSNVSSDQVSNEEKLKIASSKFFKDFESLLRGEMDGVYLLGSPPPPLTL